MSEEFVRVGGPEKHGKRWRVAKITATGQREHEYFLDDEDGLAETKARIFVLEFRERRGKRSVTLATAVTEYLGHLRTYGGNKGRPCGDNTIRIVRSKLEGLLQLVDPEARKANRGKRRPTELKIIDREMVAFTPLYARRLYSERVASGVSADTHRSELIYGNAFGQWCAIRGYVKVNPFAEVLPQGELSAGKDQLTVDEARRFYDVAMADTHPILGFASAAILLLGVRVSELLDRTVRDLDVGGTVLRITKSKTKNSTRNLVIPESLRPGFQRLAQAASNGMLVRGQSGPSAKLFGTTRSGTVLKYVARLCAKADVPVVCTHGLRGSAISNAIESSTANAMTQPTSVDAAIKAASVRAGHGGTKVTEVHYIRPGVVESARAAQAEQMMTGYKGVTDTSTEQLSVGTESDTQYPMRPQDDLTN